MAPKHQGEAAEVQRWVMCGGETVRSLTTFHKMRGARFTTSNHNLRFWYKKRCGVFLIIALLPPVSHSRRHSWDHCWDSTSPTTQVQPYCLTLAFKTVVEEVASKYTLSHPKLLLLPQTSRTAVTCLSSGFTMSQHLHPLFIF